MTGPAAEASYDYQAAITYESVVVPRYADAFSQALLRAVELAPWANVLDLCCRTGHGTASLLAMLNEGRVVAVDPDPTFLELARTRLEDEVGRRLFLKQESIEALPFGDGVFTNVVGALVDRATNDRGILMSESSRVLQTGGQLVLTMPLRGSFAEVLDIFREVALKFDLLAVAERVEQYATSMPTAEIWHTEIAARGFEPVVIEQGAFVLEYASAAEVFSDPALLVAAMPEWQWCAAAANDPAAVIYRVQEAIATYFRGRVFEITVVVGCASARLAQPV